MSKTNYELLKAGRTARVAMRQFLLRWSQNKNAPNNFDRNGRIVNIPYGILGFEITLTRDGAGNILFDGLDANAYASTVKEHKALAFAKMHLPNMEYDFKDYWPYWHKS